VCGDAKRARRRSGDAKRSRIMRVAVKDLLGRALDVDVASDATVADLAAAVEGSAAASAGGGGGELSAPGGGVRLYFAGAELSAPSEPLAEALSLTDGGLARGRHVVRVAAWANSRPRIATH
jgi:hypothetical protein